MTKEEKKLKKSIRELLNSNESEFIRQGIELNDALELYKPRFIINFLNHHSSLDNWDQNDDGIFFDLLERYQGLQFKGTEELFLSERELTAIPEGLKYLPNLNLITLRSNQITEIPNWIQYLNPLEDLYLGLETNKIEKIPDWLIKGRLRLAHERWQSIWSPKDNPKIRINLINNPCLISINTHSGQK